MQSSEDMPMSDAAARQLAEDLRSAWEEESLCDGGLQDDPLLETEATPSVEPVLNGLETFVRWDALEAAMDEGEFLSKVDFKAEVRRQFDEAGVTFPVEASGRSRGLYREVIRGLFPGYQDLYHALPATPRLAA